MQKISSAVSNPSNLRDDMKIKRGYDYDDFQGDYYENQADII